MSLYPQLQDADWLRTRYVDERMSTRDIAATIGCSMHTVLRALQQYKIPRRPAAVPLPIQIGSRVGRLVVTGQADFCGNGRRYLCLCDCGSTTLARAHDLSSGRKKSCGCGHREYLTGPRPEMAKRRDQSNSIVRTAAQARRQFTVGDLTADTGLNEKTVRRALRDMEANGSVSPPVYRWNFNKPEGSSPARPRGEHTGPSRAGGAPVAGTGGADMPPDKGMRKIAQEAVANGCQVTRRGDGHFAVTKPGCQPATLSGTPSSSRAVKNARAELRRKGLLP